MQRIRLLIKGPADISMSGVNLMVPEEGTIEAKITANLIGTIHHHVGGGFELRGFHPDGSLNGNSLLSVWFPHWYNGDGAEKIKALEKETTDALDELGIEWGWEDWGPIGIKRDKIKKG